MKWNICLKMVAMCIILAIVLSFTCFSSLAETSVDYSTNTQEQAKEGNSGVFSYKNSGPSYDQYYIIDFDEGYVYYFTEGNGSETCERLKIDEGDLNSVVIVTYHDGDDTWQNGLHFKWANQPDTLILEDYFHDEYEYRTTDLDSALSLRENKTIIDY